MLILKSPAQAEFTVKKSRFLSEVTPVDSPAAARALWQEMSLRNAQAFGLLLNTFNPEKLVLGTLAWAIGDLYTAPIMEALPRFCWPQMRADCEIVPSTLRRDISSYAGIAAALNYLAER